MVLLFWVIFAYDRQLVYPESLDAFFPLWMNHAMVSTYKLQTMIVNVEVGWKVNIMMIMYENIICSTPLLCLSYLGRSCFNIMCTQRLKTA